MLKHSPTEPRSTPTLRALPLLAPLLLALNVGCTTPPQPLPSQPVPKLKLPALPDSAKVSSRPSICTQSCSKGLTPKLEALEQTRSQSADMLTKHTQQPQNAASGPQR